MDVGERLHLGRAIRRRGYLLSPWPWRAMAYLATTAPASGVACAALLVVIMPVLAAANALRQGRPDGLPLALVLIIPSVLVLAGLPLVSAVVGMVERWRLGLVDARGLSHPRFTGLRSLYTTAAGGRQVTYSVFVGVVVPLVLALLGLLTALDVFLIASPWLAGRADRIQLAFTTVTTPQQALPLAVVGVAALPGLGYLFGAVAAGQSAITRYLLGSSQQESALREVARSRARLVDSYEGERIRIERDVHDGVLPRLTSLTLQLGLARLDVAEASPAARPLAAAQEQAQSLMTTLRAIVQGIRPQDLVELGLVGAVNELARTVSIPVEVHADLAEPAAETIETIAYFVVSETLGNVDHHAEATCAQVRIAQVGRQMLIEVSDDGKGGAHPGGGTGLTGLADRVDAVGGRVLVSSPAGGPTLVRVELPCRR